MIVLDLETFYEKGSYDLKNLSMTEYCYSPRAKCHCMAWLNTKTGEEECTWEPQQIRALLEGWYQESKTIIAFNGFFDFQFIVANRLGPLDPTKLFCAQLMAMHLLGVRPTQAHPINLKTVGPLFDTRITKYEGRGDTESFDGIRDIPDDLRADVSRYALDDVRTTADIVTQIGKEKKLGNQHLWTINWALRQYVFPKVSLDPTELSGLIKQESVERQQMLARTGITDPGIFRSVGKWRALLEEHGFKLPTKKNDKGADIPQGAKTDPFILANKEGKGLLSDLIQARLLYSSNQVATRAESYQKISKLDINGCNAWPYHVWPSGAHTHRLTGQNGGGGNPLNLDKNEDEKTYGLRNAVVPSNPDHTFIVFDYSGIELRVCRWLCGDQSSIDTILSGKDMYRVFASMCYGIPYDDIDKKSRERFIGKQAELALQYGMGWAKYQARLAQEGYHITEEEARDVVNKFKTVVHAPIKNTWGTLDNILGSQSQATGEAYFRKLNMPDHRWSRAEGIWWTSGRLLSYYNRRSVAGDYGDQIVYYPRAPWGDFNNESRIWGGTLLENICQSITNEIIDERKRQIENELGLDVVMEVYDEMIITVHKDDAEGIVHEIEEIATAPLTWWQSGPPLKVDTQIVERYGNAEK